MSTIAERVAAGVAFMDERDPGWWREDVPNAIYLKRFDIAHPCRCVIGWRYSHDCGNPTLHYLHARDAFGLGRFYNDEEFGATSDKELGFDAECSGGTDDEVAEYRALNSEWRRVIKERRAAA